MPITMSKVKMRGGKTTLITRLRQLKKESKAYRDSIRDNRNPKTTRPEYVRWRKKVLQRDHWTCQDCQKVGGELHCHHIKRWVDDIRARYDVNNGITLCVECHRGRHRKNPKRSKDITL